MNTHGKKTVRFLGEKFVRDEQSGYFRAFVSARKTTSLLHRRVWEHHNGAIPKGMQIHHINGDKDDNRICNLQLISASEHERLHGKALTSEERALRRDNLIRNAQPSAIEWHKSEAGREWHRRHYAKVKAVLRERTSKVCECCGKKFDGLSFQRFCSNSCKSAYRRREKCDTVGCVCVVCGAKFVTNKFRPSSTCGHHCRAVLIASKKRRAESAQETIRH